MFWEIKSILTSFRRVLADLPIVALKQQNYMLRFLTQLEIIPISKQEEVLIRLDMTAQKIFLMILSLSIIKIELMSPATL